MNFTRLSTSCEKDFATVAAYFQYGVEAGIFDEQQARDWALEIVDKLDHPPLDIIEVLSSRNLIGLLAALRQVGGERDIKLAGRWLYHTLFQRAAGNDNVDREITRQALQIAQSTEQGENIQFAFDSLDDCFSLAESGTYGTLADCRGQLLSLLETRGMFLG